jgi:copper(I)-binding protein
LDISMKQLLISTLLAVTACAWAQAPAPVEVKDAWVRATVAQQKATGAFMQLTAPADTRVVGARSPIAGVAQIHEMAMEKDVMRMREVKALALPAGKAVELKPGGYHVMLLDLKGQVKAGDVVPLTLVLEGKDGKRSTLDVKATARALGGAAAAAPATAGGDHGAHKH